MSDWFLTCFASGEDYIDEMRHMLETFREHHPDVPAIVAENPVPQGGWGETTCYKAQWCHSVSRFERRLPSRHRFMLWVDADARFRRSVQPPADEFHVAAKCYGGRWATGTVWFDLFDAHARRFLVDWADEARADMEHDESSFDSAAQNGRAYRLKLMDLPDSMTAPCSLGIHDFKGELEVDSAIVHWNRSRKQLGYVEDWPPDEATRRAL